jgi:DNA polymerase-1
MIALIDGDVLLYMAIWDTENLTEAIANLNEKIKNAKEGCFADEIAIAVGGPNNFREKLYDKYKLTAIRQTSRLNKADWFDELKAYLSSLEESVLTDGYEADDLLRIWAAVLAERGIPHVVVSIDKDLDCIVGNHYDPKKDHIYKVDQEYATRFYWKQILTGDSVDNIPGIEGVGPKTAEKILNGLCTEEEYKAAVCRAYYKKYGSDTGYSNLLLNGKLIHIWRYYEDYFTLDRNYYDEVNKEQDRALEIS